MTEPQNNPVAQRQDSGLSKVQTDLSDTVGARLQSLRQKFGLSQRELARRAEVTNSTLSMIEQGKVSPSVGSLEKILHAFPISLQEFFSESIEWTPTVVAAEDFVLVEKGEAELRILPLTIGNKRDSTYMAEQVFAPGANMNSQWMIHNGFIGGIVQAGCIDLHLDGVVFNLKTGDGFNFSLHRDHSFVNRSDVPCKIVCVSFSETN
ncbi:MAG: helix-turn-helix domain-containing protein [Agarilytica sp.]